MAEQTDGPNPYACGTSGMSAAEQPWMPEASRDRSSGTFGKNISNVKISGRLVIAVLLSIGCILAISIGVANLLTTQQSQAEAEIVSNLKRLRLALVQRALDGTGNGNFWPQSIDEITPGYLSKRDFDNVTSGLTITYYRPVDDVTEKSDVILLSAGSKYGLFECTKAGDVHHNAPKK